MGLSGLGLLIGNVRAESLNLVGAEMSVRIESDGQVTVFAGANKRPIATASAKLPAAQPGRRRNRGAGTAARQFAGHCRYSRLDRRPGRDRIDGHDLRELGLKNGI